MQYLYLFIITLLLCACNGSPAPATLGPTSSKPVFFEQPLNNQLVKADEPIDVQISLLGDQDFTAVMLFADDRAVRLLKLDENTWHADSLDDVLLTLSPGKHTLMAYAETEDGNSFTRTITIYAEPDPPAMPVLPSEAYITNIKIRNADSGLVYAGDSLLGDDLVPEIPIEDLYSGGIEFQVSYEGDFYSMFFYGTALKEELYVYGEQDFNVAISSDDGDYTFGDYYLSVLAHRSVGGDLIEPDRATVWFRIMDSQLKIQTRTVNFIQSLNVSKPAESKIVIENKGNLAGDFQFFDVPEWLTLSHSGASVEVGQTITVTASAPACSEPVLQNSLLKVSSGGVDTEILVTRECVDGPIFDLSLERFYFNQAIPANDSQVDSETSDIELVAGRKGIARAFVATNDDSDSRLPVVQLHYRMADGQEGVYDLVGPAAVPMTIYEGLLEQTFNAVLPEWFFESGTEFYVVIDPNNEISERLENNNRYPAEGYMSLSVRDVPPLKITLVPMVKSGSAELPEIFEDSIPVLMQSAMALMPLKGYDITIRKQPFVFTRKTWAGVLGELDTLRQVDNAEGLYFGIVKDKIVEDSDIAGYGKIGGKAALGVPKPNVIAHELGHNFGLRHANCGSPLNPDFNYPHEGAQINLWGYNIFSGYLKAPAYRDFMSYCDPEWISAYHYRKILLNRGGDLFPAEIPRIHEQKSAMRAFDAEQELLVIYGAIEGALAEIQHTYRIVDITKPVAEASPYLLKLLSADGRELYRSKFAADDVSHSEQKLFNVAIPIRQLDSGIARVIIEYKGAVYLDESWSVQASTSLDNLFTSTSLSRIDHSRVRVQWQADGKASLWLKDNQTRNTLAIDTTGDITVYSQSDSFELKYTRNGASAFKVVTLD